MALPQTACLALPGPLGPVPGTPRGRAWFAEEDEVEAEEVQASLALSHVASEVHVLPALLLLQDKPAQIVSLHDSKTCGCGIKPLSSADIIWV